MKPSKIYIPVRMKECKHLSCYELLNLLNFASQNDKNFKCEENDCNVEIPYNMVDLFDGLAVDFTLLKVINSNFPEDR